MPGLDYIPLSATASRPMATAELRALARERMRGLGYAYVATELAPAGANLRFDVIGVSRYTRQVRIYEVKSSRADFLNDAKWENYLPYCTQFAFVAPAGAIFRWELPRECGLIEYGAPAFESMRRARRFGVTILREDCLRAVRPAQRLRERVADDEWIALLEAIALGTRGGPPALEFEEGAGI
jgi:hypothetical protein